MKELASLNHYLWRYKWQLVVGLVFVITSNYFAIMQPKLVRQTVDKVAGIVVQMRQGDADVSFFDSENTHIFRKYGAQFLALALLSGVFMFLMRQMIIVTSRKIEKHLKDDIYNHLQKLSLSFYRRNNTGDIMARITEDVSNVRMYLGPGIMYTINFVSNIVLVLVIMFSVNTELTFYVLLPMPVLAISVYFVNQIIHNRSTLLQEQMSRISTYVQEMFSGIRVIKAFAAEKKLTDAFENETEEYKKRALSLVQVNALFVPLIIFLIGMSNLITIYVGGQFYVKGTASAGNIVEFFMYVSRLTWPVAAIGWVTAIIQRAAASQKRINHFMKQQPEIVGGTENIPQLKGELVFDKVSFTYPDTGIKAIQNFSLQVKPGQLVGIIGKTGSGKSTLVNLLLRQYDCDTGRILVDNKILSKLDLGEYRAQVGFVPQDNFLFSDTIYNNVLWGGDGSDNATEVDEVTQIADLYNDVKAFEKGFETVLGERGITLSGGQKQRLSIARAIYGNPGIVIFDDSFSAVDTRTEASILQSLGKYLQNRTTLLISHRVSTVKNADFIIVMEKGRIIEQGSHDELIGNKKYYYSLYKKQLLEKELKDEAL
ncbi:ATP-binding cassette domain-containing protein [bacterium]|nr:ATP-binding cassette domain-containing protein [bacterium]